MPGVRGLSVRSRRREASSGPVADPNEEVGRLVAQLAAGHTGEAAGGAPLDPTLRSKLAADLSRALAASAKTAGTAAVASGRWLGQVLIDVAPHLPLRDRATLEAHHGLSGEPLADALVRNAVRATTTVGAAGGSMAALHFFLPLSMALIPLELAAETLLVAAIEVKLVAELHEVYGVGVGGTHAQRGAAYTAAWSNRRGVDLARPASAVADPQLGRPARGHLCDGPPHPSFGVDGVPALRRRRAGSERQPPRDPADRRHHPDRPAAAPAADRRPHRPGGARGARAVGPARVPELARRARRRRARRPQPGCGRGAR